jgi:hypothetical protein
MAATSAKARIVPSDDELDNILDGIAEDRDNSRPSGVQPKSLSPARVPALLATDWESTRRS